MPIAVFMPLVTAILQIILEAQRSFNDAPDEYKERFYKRLDKWETFWEKLADPLYKLVVKEAEKLDEPTT